MARNDVYLNINALSPADAVVTGQQDMTAATVPELVLGDTPTFNFYFTDNTNVWPSWAGNAAYTVTWALSDAVSGDFSPAATTGNATPITGGWSIVLPLNAYDLVGLLNTKRVSQPYPVTNLWQQIRVADPSGNEITRAMFWTPIRYRAISDTQNTESASPTGGRSVTVDYVNALTSPTAAQFYAANPVPTSALGSAANGELLIGNGTGFTKATLTAGSGVLITNGSGSITISATDGDITLDDGTAAAPSLKFTADTDTGIYRPSDNVVGISAGGVSRATFGATSAINGTTIPGSKTLVVTTDKLSALAATTSAELAGVISDETGSGALVFATSPTLTTPILGTPQSGTLSSCTGLPIATGVSGLGTNVATALGTAVGSAGAFVVNGGALGTPSSGTLTNATGLPVSSGISGLGTNVATALAVAVGSAGAVVVNGGALGTPSSGTLTNVTGLPISSGVSGLGTNVATFLATPSSANLASAVTDETGTGALVFANTPTLVTPNIGAATGTSFNLSGSGTLGTTLTVNGTTDSSSKDTGAIVTEGGLGVEKSASIGGNLTVSGTATFNGSSVAFANSAAPAGPNIKFENIGGSTQLSETASSSFYYKAYSHNFLSLAGTSLMALSNAGNLTVSGTGTSSVAGKLAVGTTAVIGNAQFTLKKATNKNLNIDAAAGAVSGISIYAGTDADAYTGLQVDGDKLYLNARSGGNVLIGTAIDGGQKLQVSGTGYFSGNVGIGANAANRSLEIHNASTPAVVLRNTGQGTDQKSWEFSVSGNVLRGAIENDAFNTEKFWLEVTRSSSSLSFDSVKLNTGAGTTALTLDSSQNATFAGTLTLPNDKAIYFKEVGGTAQRFALNSGDVIYIEPDQLHKISIGGAGVTNVGVGGIGVAGNSVFGGNAAISGSLLAGKTTTNLATVGFRVDTDGAAYASVNSSVDNATSYNLWSTSASAYRFYVGLGGTVFATNTTISAISDVRLKENIRDLSGGLSSILALKPRVFDWKEGKGANKKNVRGFIAQEIEQVFPDLVDEWKDPAPDGESPYKSVRQDLIPVLVKAIQELTARVVALENA